MKAAPRHIKTAEPLKGFLREPPTHPYQTITAPPIVAVRGPGEAEFLVGALKKVAFCADRPGQPYDCPARPYVWWTPAGYSVRTGHHSRFRATAQDLITFVTQVSGYYTESTAPCHVYDGWSIG